MDYVYLFQFNPCVYENSFQTISAHKTKKGAYKKMRKFIEDRYKKEMHIRETCGKDKHSNIEMKVDLDAQWRIISIELEK
jgi:hypothetical protein